MEPRKPLYDVIVEELSRMDSVKIKAMGNYDSRLKDIHRIGEIVVDYDTEMRFKPYLFGLFKKKSQVPKASLEDIRSVLAKNPDIGEPVATDDRFLVYGRVMGSAEIQMIFDGREYMMMVDKVSVTEFPCFTRLDLD